MEKLKIKGVEVAWQSTGCFVGVPGFPDFNNADALVASEGMYVHGHRMHINGGLI